MMSAASQEVKCFNTYVSQSSWTDSQDWEGVSNILKPSKHLHVQIENQTDRQTNRHSQTPRPPHHNVQHYKEHTSAFCAGFGNNTPLSTLTDKPPIPPSEHI